MCNIAHHFSGKLTIPLLVFHAIVSMVVLGIPLTSVAEDVDPSLVGWWKFDETSRSPGSDSRGRGKDGILAYDSSGHGNDGILVGNPQWVAGKIGGALKFDGNGDYVDCGYDPNLNITNEVTVAAWIKLSATGIDQKVGSNQSGIAGGYKMTVFFDNKVEFEIRTSGNTAILNRDVGGGTVLQQDVWYHVAGVYSQKSNYIRTYVDGNFDRELVTSTRQALGASLGPFMIGCEPFETSFQDHHFNGVMDEVRIYNRTLTEAEIQVIMQGEEFPYAFSPTPPDGAIHPDTWVSLEWSAGAYAVSHDVYFGENYDDVDAGTVGTFQGNQTATNFIVGSHGFAYPDGLVPGTTYYWRVDEVDGVTTYKGDVWSFSILPEISITDPNFTWDRAVYWDMRYPSAWAGGGEAIRDALEYVGYEILDADQLKAWMDARISDGIPSVVVFCHDIAPDTVVESMSSRCTLRRYLDAGGKIVWYADIPMYYQGHVDGTRTNYGVNGSIDILGFNATSGPWDTQDEVAFTADGRNWGLTETWQSERPASPSGLRVLAKDASGYAAGWVKHYVPGDSYRGFVRLFDRAGKPNINDVRRVAEYNARKAVAPQPSNGAMHEDTWISLSWSPGIYAASHDIYFGENFDDVNYGTDGTFRGNQATTSFTLGFPGFPYPDGLVPGTTYYWRIDEVEADGTTKHKGYVWSFMIPPKTAFDPEPVDGAQLVDTNVELSWSPGDGAPLHIVYFGDNFDDMNNDAGGFLHETTTYTPGTLEWDKVYYWRIDEFDGVVIHKGDIWSFRTLPEIDPNLIGWWKFDERSGKIAYDSSGHDNHGSLRGDPQLVAGKIGRALDFDGSGDYVDCGNNAIFDVTDEVTVAAWVNIRTVVGDWRTIIAKGNNAWRISSYQSTRRMYFAFTDEARGWQAANSDTVLPRNEWHHVCGMYDRQVGGRIYIDGVEDGVNSYTGGITTGPYNVYIGENSQTTNWWWDGFIDDVRVYNRALTQDEIQFIMQGKEWPFALIPEPADGTLHPNTWVSLSWSLGGTAVSYDVYFGENYDDVDAGTGGTFQGNQTATYFAVGSYRFSYLVPGVTYYWRVDEVEADGTTIHKGDVWSFTVADPLSEALDTALNLVMDDKAKFSECGSF